MNILQVSAPKTGSYWLNTILKQILQKKNIPVRSFIQKQPVYQELKDQELSFKDQAGVDMIDIQENGFFYRVSSLLKEPIQDLEEYSKNATLAWTHSTWCTKSEIVFRLFGRKVILVRDPRDRALSSAKFAFTKYMQKNYPTTYISAEDFLQGEYERLLDQWVWFYGNYLLHQEELDLHFVFYENLLENFDAEFEKLLKYLDLNLKPSEKAEIRKAVAFNSMKKKSPRHLQKGRSQKWVQQLDLNQKQMAVERAGELMEIFNYPLDAQETSELPSVPKIPPKKKLEEILEKIHWQELY